MSIGVHVVSWPAPIWHGGPMDGQEVADLDMAIAEAGAIPGVAVEVDDDGQPSGRVVKLPIAYGRVFFDVPPPLVFRELSASGSLPYGLIQATDGKATDAFVAEVVTEVLKTAQHLMADGWWLDLPEFSTTSNDVTAEWTLHVSVDCARPEAP